MLLKVGLNRVKSCVNSSALSKTSRPPSAKIRQSTILSSLVLSRSWIDSGLAFPPTCHPSIPTTPFCGEEKNHPRCNAFTSFSWDFILPSTSNGDVKYMTSHVMSLLEPFTWFYQSRLNMKSWNPPFWVVQDGKTMSSTPTFPCKAGKPTWLNKKTSSQKVFQKKTKPAGDILQIIDEPNSLYTLIPWKTLVIYIKLKPRQNLNKTQNCYRHNQRCCSPLQVQQPSPS